MGKKDLPVYNIEQFNYFSGKREFYANNLADHLLTHEKVSRPHKHDFFFVALFTKGIGEHVIDFNTYAVKPGIVFFMSPGQTHNFKLPEAVDGYVFFHTKEFFNLTFTSEKAERYPFFSSTSRTPFLELKGNDLKNITVLFKEILDEYTCDRPMKFQKITALVYTLYIELARLYQTETAGNPQNEYHLSRLRKLEDLIDTHFKTIKSSAGYAEMMNMTEKNMNALSKTYLNKTISHLIADRIILEAKRMLVHTPYSISEVAAELGYPDNSYFTRFFKRKSGETPTTFIEQSRR